MALEIKLPILLLCLNSINSLHGTKNTHNSTFHIYLIYPFTPHLSHLFKLHSISFIPSITTIALMLSMYWLQILNNWFLFSINITYKMLHIHVCVYIYIMEDEKRKTSTMGLFTSENSFCMCQILIQVYNRSFGERHLLEDEILQNPKYLNTFLSIKTVKCMLWYIHIISTYSFLCQVKSFLWQPVCLSAKRQNTLSGKRRYTIYIFIYSTMRISPAFVYP